MYAVEVVSSFSRLTSALCSYALVFLPALEVIRKYEHLRIFLM